MYVEFRKFDVTLVGYANEKTCSYYTLLGKNSKKKCKLGQLHCLPQRLKPNIFFLRILLQIEDSMSIGSKFF